MPLGTPAPSSGRSGAAVERRHVLLVDDDRDIRETIEEILETEGYPVVTAKNGLEALALARADHPAMILLDLFMPVMDGVEFRHRQLEDAGLANIPVVVVSAATDLAERVRPLRVAGWLEKPLHIDELIEVVARHCAGHPHSA